MLALKQALSRMYHFITNERNIQSAAPKYPREREKHQITFAHVENNLKFMTETDLWI